VRRGPPVAHCARHTSRVPLHTTHLQTRTTSVRMASHLVVHAVPPELCRYDPASLGLQFLCVAGHQPVVGADGRSNDELACAGSALQCLRTSRTIHVPPRPLFPTDRILSICHQRPKYFRQRRCRYCAQDSTQGTWHACAQSARGRMWWSGALVACDVAWCTLYG